MPEKRKIFGAFVIALALFFLWTGVYGGWQKMTFLRGAVAEREQLLKDRQAILKNIETEYATYTQKIKAEDGQRFLFLVPAKKDVAELITAIQAIATESGVQIPDISITEASAKDPTSEQFKTLALNLPITGSYPAFQSFLKDLEKYVRLLNIDTVAIAAASDGGDKLTFTVHANTYFIK